MGDPKNLWTPPTLDLSVDRYAAFKAWRTPWEDYVIITELDRKPNQYQCAMLRYTSTEETQEIYQSLNITSNDINTAIEELKKFVRGIVNETLERHTSSQRVQEETETFDDFVTDIKILSKNCNFCATCHDTMIKDCIVTGINNDTLRKKLLAEPKLTLKQTEDICRANEKAHEGAAAMKEDKQVADTNAIYKQRKKLYPKPSNRDINRQTQRWPNIQSPNSQQPCKFCLQLHPCGAQNCPAWCKTCLKCGKRNHFKGSTVCQGNVNNANDQPDESELFGAVFIGSAAQPTETNISWEVKNASTEWYHQFQNRHRSRCHGRPSGRTNKTEHSFKRT